MPTALLQPIFDREVDRQQYNPRRWTALIDLLHQYPSAGEPSAAVLSNYDRVQPEFLSGYGYKTAAHFMENTAPGVGRIALFTFPAVINTGRLARLGPYFSLKDKATFGGTDLLRSRAIFELNVLQQDAMSPLPAAAMQRSANMMGCMHQVQHDTEERLRSNADDALGLVLSPFWRYLEDGSKTFYLESAPLFQLRDEIVHRTDMPPDYRSVENLVDPLGRYGSLSDNDLAFNPPPIYSEYDELVHPNSWSLCLKDGVTVWVTSSLCMYATIFLEHGLA
ncbi:hypothetical protein BKA70DRAFT_1443631 [Coprinopsis sp. MPI-PUGE-AT-0042]|nr:hypothetical protein BKA70DRAFT_1443631 [Coprinopsis sp. MPI-PUGE-AT-0042]